jgi:hypothetical protein
MTVLGGTSLVPDGLIQLIRQEEISGSCCVDLSGALRSAWACSHTLTFLRFLTGVLGFVRFLVSGRGQLLGGTTEGPSVIGAHHEHLRLASWAYQD